MNAVLKPPAGEPAHTAHADAYDFDPFAGAQVERVVRTSEAQREVWLADRLGLTASLAFNESVNLRLRGPLDGQALHGALQALLQRHEALRSTLSPEGTELVVLGAASLELPVFDWRALAAGTRAMSLADAADQAVRTPFDLEHGPLLRGALYRLAEHEHVLMLTAHHIVCDGWSWGVIAQDLAALYAELLGDAPAPDEAVPYSAYVQWEADTYASPAMAEHEAYWLRRFAGHSLPVLELPTDHPRTPVRCFDSRRIDKLLDAELVTAVRKFGARHGASLMATLFAGFAATLHRLTQQDDLVIGVPAAGQAASGLTALVGHCVNLLPVRVQVDAAKSLGELLRQVAPDLLDAAEHQSLAYGALLKKLPVQRDPSRLPLASVMFNVDQALTSLAIGFPGLEAELSSNPRRYENFELFVNAVQTDAGLRLECQYNSALYDARTVERWTDSYAALLRSAVADGAAPLARLAWLSPSEAAALQGLQPAPVHRAADALMHTAFVQQVALTPDRVALRHRAVALRYAELEARSNQLARALRARGIGRGERVGLCLPRGHDMVIAMLASLKAGAAYVPLDPSFPPARLDYYAQDAGLALLITDSTVGTAPAAWRADAAERVLRLDRDTAWRALHSEALTPGPQDAQPSDAAYVIYTSGSTGQPKGVCVPHRAVANFLASMQRAPGLVRDDVLAAVTTLSFDIAVLELLLPLGVGAEVLIVPRETAIDGLALRDLLQQAGVTAMQATPGMWRLLIDAEWRGHPRFKALVGGESLPVDLAHELLERSGEVWNMYGPTETTVWSTVWRVDAAGLRQRGVSIGRPIDNTRVWILDEHRQPCPVGVPGEICIGGDGVALGYLDRPELTADRFVPDPHGPAEATMYRTGDRGRWRNDGLLEHLGRLDFQVKVRGYRIELGEIEACCNGAAGVGQSVVIVRELQAGDVRIVAYLVPATGQRIDEAALREELRRRLPEYMLPQHVVVLEALPLLPNGKIDRKALPAPGLSAQAPQERVAPRNALEAQLLEQMEAVLNLPGLGVHDDFFALGGHSLLAARLTARVNRALELNLPLSTLFEAPTAARLAVLVEAKQHSSTPRRKPLQRAADSHRAPLTAMQERICFVQDMHPDRVLYNTPSAHRLTGPMDREKFELALREIVRRQASLRTRIARVAGSEERVQIVEDSVDVDLPYVDLSEVPDAEREAELMRRMQAIVDTPMDLHAAPLFRAALYRLDARTHAFLFMPHHVIWDGWSFDLFYDEMAAIYGALVQGSEHRLPALPLSYGDYAHWYADWMRSDECGQQLAYWKQRYAQTPPVAALQSEFPRRAGMTGQGATEWVSLDRATTERLRDIARGADATLNMLTMAVYTAMMASIVDRSSIVIGVPVRGRMMAEVEPVMGFFNNLLPVHLEVERERSFVDQVKGIKHELMEVLAHQDIPFERVAALPEVAAHTQRSGLYQALFSFQDARERNRQWGGLAQRAILIFQKGATEDLGLWLMEVPGGLEGGFTYNADLYSAETAAAFRERYLELLGRLATNPKLSVGQLLTADGSRSASWLRRLAARDTAATAGVASHTVAAPLHVPLSATEARLAEIWARLLSVSPEVIRATDNFFDLGGDSLLAMRAVEQSKAALGLRIEPRRYVFESLAQLASTAVATSEPGRGAVPAAAAQKPRGLMAGVLGIFGRKAQR